MFRYLDPERVVKIAFEIIKKGTLHKDDFNVKSLESLESGGSPGSIEKVEKVISKGRTCLKLSAFYPIYPIHTVSMDRDS